MFTPHTKQDIERMLAAVGASSIDELYASATCLGAGECLPARVDLPPAHDPVSLLRRLEGLAARNAADGAACFCGGGAYAHLLHPAVDQLTLRSEFLTAYTPYQAEASQGTLQAVFEFQTAAAALLGTEAANASMYDGASAAAEAVLMAQRMTGRSGVVLSGALHPEYRRTIATYLAPLGSEALEAPYDRRSGATDAGAVRRVAGGAAAVVVGYPNFFGVVEELGPLAAAAHDAGALLVTATAEATALGLVEAPGALGADIAVGEGQALGLPLGFGGPGVGLFGCGAAAMKHMPGRLVGRTVDRDGRTAYVLTLAMREQHIRRERATSNICTNHGLMALAVTMHLSLLGPRGLAAQARISAARCRQLVGALTAIPGVSQVFDGPFYDETVLRVPGTPGAREFLDRLAAEGIVAGPWLGRWREYGELADCVIVCATELVRGEDIERLARAVRGVLR